MTDAAPRAWVNRELACGSLLLQTQLVPLQRHRLGTNPDLLPQRNDSMLVNQL